jgi:hypothetical protein
LTAGRGSVRLRAIQTIACEVAANRRQDEATPIIAPVPSSHSSWIRRALTQAAVVAVLALCLALAARPGLRALARFYSAPASVRASLPEWTLPRGGEAVLPPAVRTMLGLLRENHVTEFRPGESIAKKADEVIRQRLTEAAYPIRLATQARHVLLIPPDTLPAGCRAVAARQEVVLADCG